jgi:hypothetical protein
MPALQSVAGQRSQALGHGISQEYRVGNGIVFVNRRRGMKVQLRPLTISERCLQNGQEVELFIGHHLICEVCERSFRCFRETERLCGACRNTGMERGLIA